MYRLPQLLLPLFLILILASLTACSRPKAGICSRCPVWFFDPICLTGGDVPDPPEPKVQTLPPVERDLIPGQESATYKPR
jgi:hypothetical protein